MPSYTAWWLRRHLVLGGHRPADLRAPDADPLLAGLYDAMDGRARLPTRVIARALGVRSSLAELLAEPGGADDLLGRLADPARPVTRSQLRALWSALAPRTGSRADAHRRRDRVRAVLGDEVVVADAEDVLVLDAPDLWPLRPTQPLVLAPYQHAARLADLLDLPLASEEIAGVVDGGRRAPPGPRDRRRACCRTPRRLPGARRAHGGRHRRALALPRRRDARRHRRGLGAASPGRPGSGPRATCSPRCWPTRTGPPGCSPRPTWIRSRVGIEPDPTGLPAAS